MTDELTYCLALHGVPGMGPVTMRRLIEHFGSAERLAREATEARLREVGPLPAAVPRHVLKLKERVPQAEALRAVLAKALIQMARICDPEYPALLRELTNAPPVIFIYGALRPADAQAVAIVGTTTPSPRGRALAHGFAVRLARLGCTIVSGYAHGIDSAAHRGALAAGGRTIFVIPQGVLRFRPRWGYPPAVELAARGAVISEMPPEAPWSVLAAVMRNRLIAALARTVIVIETRPRGGALHAVNAARQLGRPIFAVRYSEPPPAARGNELIFGLGGTPLTRYADVDLVLQAMGCR